MKVFFFFWGGGVSLCLRNVFHKKHLESAWKMCLLQFWNLNALAKPNLIGCKHDLNIIRPTLFMRKSSSIKISKTTSCSTWQNMLIPPHVELSQNSSGGSFFSLKETFGSEAGRAQCFEGVKKEIHDFIYHEPLSNHEQQRFLATIKTSKHVGLRAHGS